MKYIWNISVSIKFEILLFQASLTSVLTISNYLYPISDLQSALDKDFKIAVWGGTAIEDMVVNSDPNTDIGKLKQRMNEYDE